MEQQISIVSQEVKVFPGSLRFNITLKDNISEVIDSEILSVLNRLGFNEELKSGKLALIL